jgi:hypothetical protein
MTTALEWDAALDEFRERNARWAALRPYCAAMLLVLERLRADPRVGTVALQVSHATLVIEVGGLKRRISLGWDVRGHYKVSFVDPGFEFAESRVANEDDVVETVVHYLDRLRE